MSKIKKEVEQYMTGLTKTAQTITSTFVFPQEFVGFQGHFPTKKVLPGACQIQCLLSTIEKAHEKTVALKEIVLAKYFTPIFPDEALTCVFSDFSSDEDSEPIVKALLTKDATKVAELKLRVSLKGGKKKQRHA